MLETCEEMVDRLIERRHAVGITQQELANATGLTQSAIARLEAKRTVPQLDTYLKVASALGVSVLLSPCGEEPFCMP